MGKELAGELMGALAFLISFALTVWLGAKILNK